MQTHDVCNFHSVKISAISFTQSGNAYSTADADCLSIRQKSADTDADYRSITRSDVYRFFLVSHWTIWTANALVNISKLTT